MPAGMTASVLCAPLVDGPRQHLHGVHRSRYAAQLADASGRVRVCLAEPRAIRLPHALTVPELPADTVAVEVGDGALWVGRSTHRVSRWWQPACPRLPRLAKLLAVSAGERLAGSWQRLLGRGEGLTPYGDDVLCGALVALCAAGSPLAARLGDAVTGAPLEEHTTATSAALIRLAAEGWCIDALADYVTALATGRGQLEARAALLHVGATSGRGLLEGVGSVLGAATRNAA